LPPLPARTDESRRQEIKGELISIAPQNNDLFLGDTTENVNDGGATVDSGAFEVVYSDGTTISTTVSATRRSGGYLVVVPWTLRVGTVSVGDHTYTQQLSGDHPDEHFLLTSDTGSGALVTAGPPWRWKRTPAHRATRAKLLAKQVYRCPSWCQNT
jgi:hypothetical protein